MSCGGIIYSLACSLSFLMASCFYTMYLSCFMHVNAIQSFFYSNEEWQPPLFWGPFCDVIENGRKDNSKHYRHVKATCTEWKLSPGEIGTSTTQLVQTYTRSGWKTCPRELTQPEKDVLAKWLNFAVTPEQIPAVDLITATESAIRNNKMADTEAEQLWLKVSATLANAKAKFSNLMEGPGITQERETEAAQSCRQTKGDTL